MLDFLHVRVFNTLCPCSTRVLALLATLAFLAPPNQSASQGTTPTSTSVYNLGLRPESGFSLECRVTGDPVRLTPPPTGTVTYTDLTLGTTIATESLRADVPGTAWPSVSTKISDPARLAAGDFNGDGKADLAVVQAGSTVENISILIGKGDGTFQSPTIINLPGVYPPNQLEIVTGDFNNDGKLDLVFGTRDPNTSTGWIQSLLGDGNGGFSSGPSISFASTSPTRWIITADFNKDGKLDLAAGGLDNSFVLLLGRGDGAFIEKDPGVTVQGGPFTAADINQDGKPDLVFADGTVLLGKGDGTFLTGKALPFVNLFGAQPFSIAAGDFNGDGFTDVVVSYNRAEAQIVEYRGNSDGTFFVDPTRLVLDSGDFHPEDELIAGDFDGVGLPDDLLASGHGGSAYFYPRERTDQYFGVSNGLWPADNGYGGDGVTAGDFAGNGTLGIAGSRSSTGEIGVWLRWPLEGISWNMLDQMYLFSSLRNQPHQVQCSYSGDSVYSPSVSNPVSVSYPQAPPPAFSPSPGYYNSTQLVSIRAAADIYYTVDGSTPTTASRLYTGPIQVSSSVTIKAITSGSTYADSNPGVGVYIITDLLGHIDRVLDERTNGPTVAQSDNLLVSGWASSRPGGAPVANVDILIDGKVAGSVTPDIFRPDVATAYKSYTYLYSGWSLTYPAANLSAGNHVLTAVIHDSVNQSMPLQTLQFTVGSTSVGPPFGSIDLPPVSTADEILVSPLDTPYILKGWAADLQDKAPVKLVIVWTGASGGVGATTGQIRSDVAAAYNNPAYLRSGWSEPLQTLWSSGPGIYKVWATATNSLGLTSTLDTRTFKLTYSSGDLSTAIDARTNSTTVARAGNLLVKGWAVDVKYGPPVSRVQILLDGNVVGNATQGLARPDIATAFNNSAYLNSGWTFTYAASGLSLGTHTVSAVAYDGHDPKNLPNTLGSKTFTVGLTSDSPPFGHLDSAEDAVTKSSIVSQVDNLLVKGWAADQQDHAPVSNVQILVDGNIVGNATLGLSRPDVAAAFNNPAYLNSGWTFTCPVSNLHLGIHYVTAIFYNSLNLSTTINTSTITVQ